VWIARRGRAGSRQLHSDLSGAAQLVHEVVIVLFLKSMLYLIFAFRQMARLVKPPLTAVNVP